MYDAVIVGAGPAGAAVARLLAASGGRILLVDRRRLDEPGTGEGEKPCGGLLSPAAQRELARQGLAVPDHVAAGPHIFAVRTIDLESGDEGLYQRHYLNVDRDRFDRWLVDCVPESVQRVFGWSLVHLAEEDEGVTVQFTTGSGSRVGVRALLVVGADGAASLVRRHASLSGTPAPYYTAVQGVFEADDESPHFGAMFDSRLTDHYGWMIPKRGKLLAGIALPSAAGASGCFETFVERCRAAGVPLGREVTRSSAPVLRPRSPGQVRLGTGRILLVGEAAGFVSPSSAEGIGYALRSAAALVAAAAECMTEGRIDGSIVRSYRRRSAPLVAELCAKVAKAAVIGSPVTRRAIIRSGACAMRSDGTDGLMASLTEVLAP